MFDDVILFCANVSIFHDLMVVAEENGYLWLSGDRPTELVDAYEDGMPAHLHLNCNGRISFADPDAYITMDAEEYLEQFANPPEPEDLSILYG